MITRPTALATALACTVTFALVMSLSACGTTGPASPDALETFVPVPSDAVDTPEAIAENAIEPDTTLVVSATATADNGAQLRVQLQVHKSTAWDDIAAQTLPAALTADCGSSLTKDVFAAGLWSFTRANLTSIPVGSTPWPAQSPIRLSPSAQFVKVAGRGMLAPAASAGATCTTDKQFAGAGKGAMAVGIAGDVLGAGASGALTRWALHSWGFAASGPGVTISDCTFQVTELGAAQGGGAASWAAVTDAQRCITGAATDTSEY